MFPPAMYLTGEGEVFQRLSLERRKLSPSLASYIEAQKHFLFYSNIPLLRLYRISVGLRRFNLSCLPLEFIQEAECDRYNRN